MMFDWFKKREKRNILLEYTDKIQESVDAVLLKDESISLPTSNMKEVKQFALTGWVLGSTHGLSHWERVERNGILLSYEIHNGELHFNKDVNIKVVRLFAYLHDKCRVDDGLDLEHGERSAEMLHTIRDTLLQELTDDEFAMLEQACRLHSITHKTGNPTIDTCFDADRLDLERVGITPSPERMATKRGEYYAMHPHKFEAIAEWIKI